VIPRFLLDLVARVEPKDGVALLRQLGHRGEELAFNSFDGLPAVDSAGD